MKEFHNLRQVLLGLILTGHIRKPDSLGGVYIDSGIALAHAEHHGIAAAHALLHLLRHILSQHPEDGDRQHPA